MLFCFRFLVLNRGGQSALLVEAGQNHRSDNFITYSCIEYTST